MPQVISLLQNGLDALACYLGNDIRMQIEYNGSPDSSIQVGEVSTFALDGEGGAPSTTLRKQSLDSLEFDLQEEIEDDLIARSILTGKGKRASDSEGENSSTEEEMRPLVTSSGECGSSNAIPRTRRPWTIEEKAAVLRHFADNISYGKLPGKKALLKCLKSEPVLQDRTWTMIKDFIRNTIATRQRRKSRFL
ncbi:hypothetical protein HOLleu_42073 [Holothuria leucospilota]|uniref:Myb-like domain-containing protein n=1 Tax=Holothuria leucospilota TaxID=206669 RepID=A0A9Q0YF82_HOLLE|nr:hypothetical protein HOLleu_42073 [Holothuria leucospilota]